MNFNRAIPRVATAALAVSAALAMVPATAADSGVKTFNPKFEALDKNSDGFITRDEVKGTRWYGSAFSQADENRDGRLDQTEFAKADAIQDRNAAGNSAADTTLKAKANTKVLVSRP